MKKLSVILGIYIIAMALGHQLMASIDDQLTLDEISKLKHIKYDLNSELVFLKANPSLFSQEKIEAINFKLEVVDQFLSGKLNKQDLESSDLNNEIVGSEPW